MSEPTQVRRPWRATARTTLATLVAIAVAAAPHIDAIDWTDRTVIGVILACSAFVTRALADPRIERLLRKLAPAMAADPDPAAKHSRKEPHDDDRPTVRQLRDRAAED